MIMRQDGKRGCTQTGRTLPAVKCVSVTGMPTKAALNGESGMPPESVCAAVLFMQRKHQVIDAIHPVTGTDLPVTRMMAQGTGMTHLNISSKSPITGIISTATVNPAQNPIGTDQQQQLRHTPMSVSMTVSDQSQQAKAMTSSC